MSLPPQTITRTAPFKFTVENPGSPLTDTLRLDFGPLLDNALYQAPMVMIHFQARPKGLRRWGLYDSHSDTYHSFDSDSDVDTEAIDWNLLSIPDSEFPSTIPTCVFVAYNVVFNPNEHALESQD